LVLDLREKLILLVENNPDDELLALRAFKKYEMPSTVVVAHHGGEALDFLFGNGRYAERDLSQMPDVILLDLKMPKVSGLEVLRRIRNHERTRLLPVVIFSSSIEPLDVLRCYQYGANSYIRKPVDLDQMDEIMKVFLPYWLFVNQTTPHPFESKGRNDE
jgi:two-component system, response regulator